MTSQRINNADQSIFLWLYFLSINSDQASCPKLPVMVLYS